MVAIGENADVVRRFYGFCDELPLILAFLNFLRRFLLGFGCCYRPLVSGFAGWLKLIAIKTPCKTAVLCIC